MTGLILLALGVFALVALVECAMNVTAFGFGVHHFVFEWRRRWALAWSYEHRCLYFWNYGWRNPVKVSVLLRNKLRRYYIRYYPLTRVCVIAFGKYKVEVCFPTKRLPGVPDDRFDVVLSRNGAPSLSSYVGSLRGLIYFLRWKLFKKDPYFLYTDSPEVSIETLSGAER